jgi:hypothetical protein
LVAQKKSAMTVQEAGKKGGQKVKQLIEEGKRAQGGKAGKAGGK